MNAPGKPALTVLIVTASLFGAACLAREMWPPPHARSNPRLATLHTEREQLTKFTDEAAHEADAQLAALRTKLWTADAVAAWRKANVPDTWAVQELGGAGLDQARGRRYAFSRPNTTDKEWNEITAVLGALEKAPCVRVQSAALGVQPGYDGSRRFTQCLLVAVFYFGDESAARHGPGSSSADPPSGSGESSTHEK